jgi:hypothetical protein
LRSVTRKVKPAKPSPIKPGSGCKALAAAALVDEPDPLLQKKTLKKQAGRATA